MYKEIIDEFSKEKDFIDGLTKEKRNETMA